MRRTLAIAALCLLALAGCGDDDDVESPATATPGGSGSASASGLPTGTTASALPTGGVSQPLLVPEDGGPTPLSAGSWHTSRLTPSAFFAIGEGWSAQFDNERLLQLFRRREASPQTLTLLNPDGVIDPDSGDTLPLPEGVEGLVQWIAENPALTASSPSSLQVGILAARQMQITADADVEYLAAGGTTYGIAAGEKQHIIVADFREQPVVIAVSAPADEFGEFFTVIEPVVNTLTFTD